MESGAVAAPDPHRTVETVWRMESAKIIGALTRIVRDVGIAEELAQDAMVAALQQWGAEGIPQNPAAWLMGTAKHRAIDLLRRRSMHERKQDAIAYETSSERTADDLDARLDDDVGDDVLRLAFTACHPVLSSEAQVALTLRLLCGLTIGEIARAFLAPEPTIAQRIVRAKKALAAAQVPFEVPRGAARAERVASVLAVVYLVFNEGYAAAAGERWSRASLCEEAVRLGRVLAALMPEDAEVHGLVALMELQASRLRARVGASGEPVLLNDQSRARWDPLLIRRGLASLARAERLEPSRGVYTLQAAIAACHARAAEPSATDWPRIVELYTALAALTGSPVVALNRAVAVGMASGPAPALALVDAIAGEPAMRAYPYLPGVRGHLLEQLGRLDEARAEFERSASLTGNAHERAVLSERARKLAASPH